MFAHTCVWGNLGAAYDEVYHPSFLSGISTNMENAHTVVHGCSHATVIHGNLHGHTSVATASWPQSYCAACFGYRGSGAWRTSVPAVTERHGRARAQSRPPPPPGEAPAQLRRTCRGRAACRLGLGIGDWRLEEQHPKATSKTATPAARVEEVALLVGMSREGGGTTCTMRKNQRSTSGHRKQKRAPFPASTVRNRLRFRFCRVDMAW